MSTLTPSFPTAPSNTPNPQRDYNVRLHAQAHLACVSNRRRARAERNRHPAALRGAFDMLARGLLCRSETGRAKVPRH
jgi:hypothetical protein